MEVSDGWRATVADDELRRRYPEVDFDDAGWTPIDSVSQWRSNASFATTDGPLLYRTNFSADAERTRSWLCFDGIFYNSDVWLDGNYVGDTEGYFVPHAFEVTELLSARSEHTLAMEVACSRADDLTQKRNITGIFEQWDCLNPDDSPGGIWRPVRVEHTGPVRIDTLRLSCSRTEGSRATLDLAADLDTLDSTSILVRTVVRQGDRAVDHEAEHKLAAGDNAISWKVEIEEPKLWWPHALGDPNLAEVTVEVFVVNSDGSRHETASDTNNVTTGLRSVAMRNFRWTINGERLFVKAVNHGPATQRLADASPDQVARDIELAKEANLDMVRVHAHVARPELYDAADRAGMLVWQDLPLLGGYARGLRKQATRQARAMVDVLGHHPSIAIWCGHTGMRLPRVTTTVLDAAMKRALENADKSRPVLGHAGLVAPAYLGWSRGEEREFPAWLRRVPRFAEFVNEFGSQAIPDNDEFMGADAWPNLDWGRLARNHGLELEPFERYVPPSSYPSYDDWRAATQRYQATILKYHIETLRRLKYRPAGGFAAFFWADAHPAVTCSVLDHQRTPKLGYYALVAACAPVIVVSQRPAETYEAGELLQLDVHVISDRRAALTSVRTTATVTFANGFTHRQAWDGEVPADSCVRIGTIAVTAPEAAGPVTIELTASGEGLDITNQYVAQVLARGASSASMEP